MPATLSVSHNPVKERSWSGRIQIKKKKENRGQSVKINNYPWHFIALGVNVSRAIHILDQLDETNRTSYDTDPVDQPQRFRVETSKPKIPMTFSLSHKTCFKWYTRMLVPQPWIKKRDRYPQNWKKDTDLDILTMDFCIFIRRSMNKDERRFLSETWKNPTDSLWRF